MGCSTSSQTSAVESNPPVHKQDESNGASTTGAANENGKVAEDSETIPDQTPAQGGDAKPADEPAAAATSADNTAAAPPAAEDAPPAADSPPAEAAAPVEASAAAPAEASAAAESSAEPAAEAPEQASVEFLGFFIEQWQVRSDPSKVQKVTYWLAPENYKQLQCFLGFANFYCHYIQDYSHVVSPLTQLTSTKLPFLWTSEADEAYTSLKELSSMTPALAHPEP
ncbi:uncharacterized protein LOC115572312 [Sparus aurata]|uniref:uncharacterized protein LOC115572312 n=1 Tax=Sparus aurata TaxID=8175 RepID=UPI0011C1B5E2|nr:uncharacterized protein LOC115572312 [Sparus aurata]